MKQDCLARNQVVQPGQKLLCLRGDLQLAENQGSQLDAPRAGANTVYSDWPLGI